MHTRLKRGWQVAGVFGLLVAGVAMFGEDGGSAGGAVRPADSAQVVSAEGQDWVAGDDDANVEALVHSAARGGQYLTGELPLPTEPDEFEAAVMDVASFCDLATMATGELNPDCTEFFKLLYESILEIRAARGAE